MLRYYQILLLVPFYFTSLFSTFSSQLHPLVLFHPKADKRINTLLEMGFKTLTAQLREGFELLRHVIPIFLTIIELEKYGI